MAEWLCSGLQNRVHRFNSGPGLHFFIHSARRTYGAIWTFLFVSNQNFTASHFIRRGVIEAINVPGFALCSTLVGFGAIAREAGFDIWMTTTTTLLVFGMPGQVAMATLYAGGSSLILIFIAVSLANMRMMLMVISGSDLLKLPMHNLPFWKRLLLMQGIAITTWAQIGLKQSTVSPENLVHYFKGFASAIYAFAVMGTIIGFYLDNFIPEHVLRIVIFVTPLYLLMVIINAKQTTNKLAVVIGGTLCPLLYPFTGDWAILYAGFIGGTLGALIMRMAHSRSRS